MRDNISKLICFCGILLVIGGCDTKLSPRDELVREIESLNGFVVEDEQGYIFYINLCSCDINHALIQKLSAFNHLQYLYLEHTDIDNKDLEYIGKIQSLEVLNINLTSTTDEGLFFLLKLNNLKGLKMSHYRYTRPLPKELKEAGIDDLLSDKVKIDAWPNYGDGIRALVKKFPGLKAELWGGFPE